MSRIRCAGIAAASLTALCILSPIAASAKPVNGELAALAKQGSTLQQARFYGGYGYVRPSYRGSYGYHGYYGYPRYYGYRHHYGYYGYRSYY
jgi:hypothetical protein